MTHRKYEFLGYRNGGDGSETLTHEGVEYRVGDTVALDDPDLDQLSAVLLFNPLSKAAAKALDEAPEPDPTSLVPSTVLADDEKSGDDSGTPEK